MKVSLIITTYNWVSALSAVLDSVKKQSILPGEVIIADDGSNDLTKKLIDDEIDNFPVPLIHSWQKDDGFRAAESRNNAVSKSNHDYLIMIDGDIILHEKFIESHIRNAKRGFFVQGGRAMMNEKLSNRVLSSGYVPNFFSPGLKNRKNTINSIILSRVFSKIQNSINKTRSCNFACWKSDYILINGFDNDFVGWGREDSEFVQRLLNSNLQRIYLKFSGICFHIYHNENSRVNLQKNDDILNNTITSRRTTCNNGYSKFL